MFEAEQETHFLQYKCRLSGEDVDVLCKQNRLDAGKQSLLRSMMVQFALRTSLHVYYRIIEEKKILAVMTLGKAADAWCESFLSEDEIWKGYMADQIAMCALRNGYEMFRRTLQGQYGRAVSGLTFWEEEDAGCTLLQALSCLSQGEVTVSPGGQLQPLKSVLFTVTILGGVPESLTEACTGNLCDSCKNVTCPNRIADDGGAGNICPN